MLYVNVLKPLTTVVYYFDLRQVLVYNFSWTWKNSRFIDDSRKWLWQGAFPGIWEIIQNSCSAKRKWLVAYIDQCLSNRLLGKTIAIITRYLTSMGAKIIQDSK